MVKQWGFAIITLGFILCIGWSQLTVTHQTINVHPLVQSFQTNEWQADTWVIHHGAPLDQPLTDQQVNSLIRYFRLTESGPPFPHTPNSNQAERVYTSDWWRNIPLEIRVIRRVQEKNVFAHHYLVVEMEAVGQHPQALADAVEHISSGLQEAGVTPHMQVSLQGTAPEMLQRGEQQQLIERIMDDLDAHEVEALRDATSTSVSAFSPHTGKPIVSGGQEMNVQIAARTDRVLRKTVITMGTPIITIEY